MNVIDKLSLTKLKIFFKTIRPKTFISIFFKLFKQIRTQNLTLD